MFEPLIRFVREQYRSSGFIPLHAPTFRGHERDYVVQTIDSTFVSSVGEFVDRFERDMAAYTGAPRTVATVNGTAALHVALMLVGVERGDLVLTQSLNFVAGCNAIAYCGAEPVFLDVDRATLGLSAEAVESWLADNARLDNDGLCRAKADSRVIRACLPMHTFGHPVDLDGLSAVCGKWNMPLIEDAAEAVGSRYKDRHVGTLGLIGILSFNGNKIITTGGGGMILSSPQIGARAKHLTTTAKKPHAYEFLHDEIGYNYRLPNLNAALGCAQLEMLEALVAAKRDLAQRYAAHLKGSSLQFVTEPPDCRSNYWLNAVICGDRKERDALLDETNREDVMTRPIWRLLNRLPMFAHCRTGPLANAEWLEDRVVNLPSSVLPADLQ
jgi:aminotransferase in exopolysaccharide biosynthesis